MKTVVEMMAVAALGLLFALAWHNQPVREPAPARRATEKPERQGPPSAQPQADL